MTVEIRFLVSADLDIEITQAAAATDLSKADVMRQGLRLGVPKVLEAFKASQQRKRPACLDYLDEYLPAPVTAKESAAHVKEKVRRHAASNRRHRFPGSVE